MYWVMKVLTHNRDKMRITESCSAMKRMAVSNVLIVGLHGLGAEIGGIHSSNMLGFPF